MGKVKYMSQIEEKTNGRGGLSEDELMKNVVARLVVGEHVDFKDKFKLLKFAIRKAWSYSPEAKLEKQKFGEFAVDYNADKTPKLGDLCADYSFSIDSEDGEFLGECGLALEDGHLELWMFDKSDIKTGKIVYFFGEKNRPSKLDESVDPEKIIDLFSLNPREEVVVIETTSLKLSVSFIDVVFEYHPEGGIKKMGHFSAQIHVSRKELGRS